MKIEDLDIYDEWQGLRAISPAKVLRLFEAQKTEKFERGYRRYEALRKLNPQQFTKLYEENIRSGVPFDTLVDRLAVQSTENQS